MPVEIVQFYFYFDFWMMEYQFYTIEHVLMSGTSHYKLYCHFYHTLIVLLANILHNLFV